MEGTVTDFPSCCILDETNNPVSWMLTHTYGAIGFLYNLPEHCRKGYAKVLVTTFVKTLHNLGYPIYCFIEEENEVSHELFQKLGFKAVPDVQMAWMWCTPIDRKTLRQCHWQHFLHQTTTITTCKPSSDKKNDDHLSDLSMEVDSTASLNLSELSTEDLKADEENFISHGRDRIRRMWDGFSLEMYTTCEKPEKLGSSNLQRTKIIKKEHKHWSPKITIPEPFQMTLREDEKKQQKIRSRSEMEIKNYTLRKQLEEEAECQKLFRANPAPAHTYIPLMEEIMERNEERRTFIKARSKETLLAIQKPFAFLEREEKKKEIKNMQIIDLAFSVKKTKIFKAKPVPKYLHDQTMIDRIKEEELYRAIRMKVRAQEMLNSASLPKSMLHNAVLNRRKKVCCETDKKLKFKPHMNAKVPDFEILHRKSQRQLTKKKLKLATACEPFQLHTSHVFSKNNIMNDTTADENQLKEVHRPCRKQSKSHIIIDLSPSRSLDLEIIKSTDVSKKKEAVRNHQRKRTTNNLLELDEMQERENRRPFLLEVLAQRDARRPAERYHKKVQDAQKERRFKKKFVSWQSHSVLQSSGRESVENEDESSIYEESSQVETDGLDFDFQEDIEDKESSGVEENEDQESEAE
ncbi:protein FAM161A isoform X2 [Rhinoraja longicauda]